MLKWCVPVLLLLSSQLFAQTSITGSFKLPDGTNFNGKVTISLAQAARNSCGSRAIGPFPITLKITNGTMPFLSLWPTTCLTPPKAYVARVATSANVVIYTGHWTVPNQPMANVGELETQ